MCYFFICWHSLVTCQWFWEQKSLKILVCFSVTWKFRTTKSLPRQPGLLSIVTCFHLSNKCCQFLRFVTDSASVSFHLMMWLTAPSQNCLIDCSASFLTPLSTQCGGNISDPFCLWGTLEQRLFCYKEVLLSAFLLWLTWVALLRCTPACVFSTAFLLTWADTLISLVMYRCECWILFILFFCAALSWFLFHIHSSTWWTWWCLENSFFQACSEISFEILHCLCNYTFFLKITQKVIPP